MGLYFKYFKMHVKRTSYKVKPFMLEILSNKQRIVK